VTTPKSPREKAEQQLTDAPNVAGYGHAQATAIAGVGWAILDLVDAIRDGHRIEGRRVAEAINRSSRRSS
jgi:hypothetical protein